MSESTITVYQQLLKQFYRKSLKSHPNRHDLIAKFIKRIASSNQQRYLQVQIPKPNSPKSNRSNVKLLDIGQITKSKINSSRDIQPQSAKLLKKYSDQKSSYSAESDISKQKKRNRDQQKYFNCQWLYRSGSLKKIICYALIFIYFQTNDLYNFTRVNDNIEIYLNQNNNLDNDIRNGVNQWGKIQQTFNKKDKVRWTKILPEIFINLNNVFIGLIFEFMTRVKSMADDYKTLNRQNLQTISKYVKVNINYFQILHQQIQKTYQKLGTYKIEINLGYIKQQDCYVFSNRFPQKSQIQVKRQKVIKNISESIANLLRQYDANTEKLLSLEILSEPSSKQNNSKNYISKKDVLK